MVEFGRGGVAFEPVENHQRLREMIDRLLNEKEIVSLGHQHTYPQVKTDCP